MRDIGARRLATQNASQLGNFKGTGTSAPTTGTYNLGDKIWNSSPQSGSYLGWECVAAGSPGTWIPFGGLSKSVSEVLLTSTSATTILSLTPQTQGNFDIKLYYRVVTASTNVTITVSYTSSSGAQVSTIVAGNSQLVGDYSGWPTTINATSSSPITVTATAGTSNQVYVSCSIIPL